jgi:hypothetical protein
MLTVYLTISVLVVLSLLLGVLVEFMKSIKERKWVDKNKKYVKLQQIVTRGQRLLQGCMSLSLTAVSSIVCLERNLTALNALIKIKRTENRLEAKAEIESKLLHFRQLSPAEDNFYALLSIPHNETELRAILNHSMMLMMTLKADQFKGYVNVADVQEELDQLDILTTRLKSSIFHIQARQALDNKMYHESGVLNENSLALLTNIKSTDEAIISLINEKIDVIKLFNEGVAGVVEAKNHDFHDKFKKQSEGQENNVLSDGLDDFIWQGRKKPSKTTS